jgi:hypothetical protein
MIDEIDARLAAFTMLIVGEVLDEKLVAEPRLYAAEYSCSRKPPGGSAHFISELIVRAEAESSVDILNTTGGNLWLKSTTARQYRVFATVTRVIGNGFCHGHRHRSSLLADAKDKTTDPAIVVLMKAFAFATHCGHEGGERPAHRVANHRSHPVIDATETLGLLWNRLSKRYNP